MVDNQRQCNLARGALLVANLGIIFNTIDLIFLIYRAPKDEIRKGMALLGPQHIRIADQSTANLAQFNAEFGRSAALISYIGDAMIESVKTVGYYEPTNVGLYIWEHILTIFLCILVIVALKKDKHYLYLHYLFFGALNLVYRICLIIMISVIWIRSKWDKMDPIRRQEFHKACGILISLAIVSLVFTALVYWIVYRAYKQLKEEKLTDLNKSQIPENTKN